MCLGHSSVYFASSKPALVRVVTWTTNKTLKGRGSANNKSLATYKAFLSNFSVMDKNIS
jgi:hypothetical protein